MLLLLQLLMMMMIVCVQLLLHISIHMAVSLYSLTGVLAAIMSLLLPIETKGRQMMVRCHVYSRSACVSVILLTEAQETVAMRPQQPWYSYQSRQWVTDNYPWPNDLLNLRAMTHCTWPIESKTHDPLYVTHVLTMTVMQNSLSAHV